MPKKAHGLGRGLDALLPEDESQDLTGVQMIDIGRIDPNLDQPRKAFSQESISLLAQSISVQGILQPILVVKGNKDRFTIVAGERRWRAAREAGLKEVPCLIREMDKTQQMEVALIENLQREDLNPLEVAQGIRQLMDQCDYTQEEVAKRLGKSRPAVANLLRLLTLPSSVCDLIREGVLSAGHARVLAGLDDVERQRQLAEETVSKGYSVRQLEEIAAMTREEKPRKHARSEQETLSSELSQLETRLREAMGVRVTLKGSDTRGRIILQYYTKDELEHVNELLEKLTVQDE